MFPNPQDALPLPAHPNKDQYRKLAKELVRAANGPDPGALREWSAEWVDSLVRLYGMTLTAEMPVRVDRWVNDVEGFVRRTLAGKKDKPLMLADAQFVIARSHGFLSWSRFAGHLDELKHENSTTSSFEAAADAIISGDENTLLTHLRVDADLVRARSTREHNATLLHYTAANGVEGWRQCTPKNIVAIAETLLDAGAEIDAVAQMYGGDCTTLGLAATSVHPERAGVQISLLTLLLDRGARMDRDNSAGNGHLLVKACLANGRGDAAEFLAARGAALDLETAAGVGAIDFVKSHVDDDGRVRPGTDQEQMRDGFLWACQFGRGRVIEYLLSLGFDLSLQDRSGQTGLHHAVIGAQTETVKLLLKHGAPLETKNTYGGTVLGQAIWSAYNADSPAPYLPILEELLAAGAQVEPEMEDALAKLLRRRRGPSA